MTLLIAGGRVVRRLSPPVLEVADVLIDDGRIAAISRGLDTDGDRIDATGCVVVPGAVNAHTHAYSALARGMPYKLAPPASFLEVLQRVWWRLDRALDPDSIRASALVAARDALLSGTSTLIDHHASPYAIDGSLDIVAQAFAQAGVRSVLAYEVSDRDGPALARAGLDENERFIRLLKRHEMPLTRAMVGAHACFTLSEATLGDCLDLCALTGAGLHIHAAEDGIDAGAAGRLSRAGGLTATTLLAHAVHVDADEAETIRASGATVAHNCRSNLNNAVGRMRVDDLGSRVALGTDGIGADMFAESQAAYFEHRADGGDAEADWALARLSSGSAFAGRVFGELLLGRLDPGAPADVAVLDYAPPTPIVAHNLAAHWVFGLSRGDVRDVIVNGEIVVRERRLTLADDSEILAHAREQAARLWSRVATIPAHEFERVTFPRLVLVHNDG